MDLSPGERLRSRHLEVSVSQAEQYRPAKCGKQSGSTASFAGEAWVAPGRCSRPGPQGPPSARGRGREGCALLTPQLLTQRHGNFVPGQGKSGGRAGGSF